MLGFFSILRPGLPTRNPEVGKECPLVSASQTRLNRFRESLASLGKGLFGEMRLLVLANFVQPPRMALGFRSIHRRYLAAKGIPGFCGLSRRLNAADATPALSGLGFDLAHFINRMMSAAVVTELGFLRHGWDCLRD
jgi:hypothetical protein